jgi:hypothetical protein
MTVTEITGTTGRAITSSKELKPPSLLEIHNMEQEDLAFLLTLSFFLLSVWQVEALPSLPIKRLENRGRLSLFSLYENMSNICILYIHIFTFVKLTTTDLTKIIFSSMHTVFLSGNVFIKGSDQ